MVEQSPSARTIFTYDEAAALLPEVRRLTEEAHARVEALAESAGAAGEAAQAEADDVVSGWARAIAGIGVEVKGLWLVDFDNGSGYYCWKFPEPGLHFYHGYEDGFRGRLRIH